MGQALSEHELFIQSLSKSLKTRETKVKTKELLRYFDYIHQVCPWFPLEGTIDIVRWKKVGDALTDYYRVFGPRKVPWTAFYYWNLIAGILNPKIQDPLVSEIYLHGEQALKVSARNTPVPQLSCSPHVSIRMEDSAESSGSDEEATAESHPRETDSSSEPPVYSGPPTLYPTPTSYGEGNWSELARKTSDCDTKLPLPSALPPANVSPPDGLTQLENEVLLLEKRVDLERRRASLLADLQSFRLSRPAQTTVDLVKMAAVKSESETTDFSRPRQAFPVLETVTPAQDGGQPVCGRAHTPLAVASLKELKTAGAQYGPTAPYTIAVLETVSQGWITPKEWHDLAKATLSGGHFLLWKSEYLDQCETLANDNVQANNGWTLAMLSGTGDYTDLTRQINYDPGLFAQVTLAALRAWKKLPSENEPTASLAKLYQGAEEPFESFVDRLLQAATRLLERPISPHLY